LTRGGVVLRAEKKTAAKEGCSRACAQPECASTQNSSSPRERIFFITSQTRTAPGKNAFGYGASSSGLTIGEYDQAGNAIREYVWLGSTPIAMFMPDPANAANPPLVYYIHTDHLNTPRVVVDRNNNLRWRWMAEPFGTTAPENNPRGLGGFTQNLRFPGQYADAESGLFYNWHRDYDNSIGRYTQSDPIGLEGGINTYSYADNRPTSQVDSRGLAACPGGTWDQEFGDLSVQLAAGGLLQGGNLNIKCREKPALKCNAKQVCIGGGPLLSAGVSLALGGVMSGAADSQGLSGWGGWSAAVGVGPFGGQIGGDGGQTSVGPNVGWKYGVAAMRCFTYAVKCTEDECKVDTASTTPDAQRPWGQADFLYGRTP
jgi:RHS repeat-associated protein